MKTNIAQSNEQTYTHAYTSSHSAHSFLQWHLTRHVVTFSLNAGLPTVCLRSSSSPRESIWLPIKIFTKMRSLFLLMIGKRFVIPPYKLNMRPVPRTGSGVNNIMRISFNNISCSMYSNNYLKIKVHWPENFGCKANLHPITPNFRASVQSVTTTQNASATQVLRD
jgi:hypothetical protein